MSQLKQALEKQVQEVLEFLDKFIGNAGLLSAQLQADLKASEEDVRLIGVGQTQAVLAHEVLLCCVPKWLLLSGQHSNQERFQSEFQSRVLEMLRQQFISTMSAIEFCAREAVAIAKDSPLATAIGPLEKRDLYLRLIMQKSQRLGLVSGDDLGTWTTLIEIRNMLVHNNGYADVATIYEVAGQTLTLAPGKMTEIATFLAFPKFAEEAVLQYGKWLRSLFGGQE